MIQNASIQRVDRPDGLTLMVAENRTLPRVGFRVVLRSGAAEDPDDLMGLTRVHSELVLRGTKKRNRRAFAETIEGFGSSLSGDGTVDSQTFGGEALSRHFEATLALLAEALLEPAFDEAELKKLLRELDAERQMRRDDDSTLARLFYRRLVFAGHVYGRDPIGTPTTLAAITAQRLREEHARRVVRGNVIVAAAGDIDLARLGALVDKYFARLPAGGALTKALPPPAEPEGIRVYLVDKPERTQVQIVFGRPAIKATNPDYLALHVATTAFGGTFTSPLMHEVREVRGWSYGAYASVAEMRGRGSFSMSAAPAQEEAAPCLALMVDLYKKFVVGDFPADIYGFARRYLRNQHPFSVATPDARLSEYLHSEIIGQPEDAVATYPDRLDKLSLAELPVIAKRYLSEDDLVVVLVGTAKTLEPAIAKLPFVSEVTVLPYDKELP